MTTTTRSSWITVSLLVIILTSFATAASATDLEITVRDDAADPIYGADVTINSPIHEQTQETNFDGQALFEDIDDAVYDVTVEHEDYQTRELTVNTDDNASRTVVMDEETVGDLTIHVTDDEDQDIEDAQIELAHIEGSTTENGTTDRHGELTIERLPAGQYEATITKATYADKTVTINVRAGDTTYWSTSMTSDGTEAPSDLVIEEYSVPSPLKRDQTATITFTARNQDDRDIDDLNATLFLFDTNQTITNITIEEDTTYTDEFTITVPEDASGTTPMRLTVANHLYNATQTHDIQISDYAGFIELGQTEVEVGDTVFVSGQITNTDTRNPARTMGANLYLDRSLITGVTTDQTGGFSAFVRPETIGTKTVRVTNQYFELTEPLRVRPALSLQNIQASPNTIRTGDTSEVCATVETGRQRDITLTVNRDGEQVHETSRTINQEARPCFDIQYNTTGMIPTTIIASFRSTSASAQTQVNVTEDPSFPLETTVTDQLSIELGDNGTAWINATNPSPYNHTATIELGTINNSWLDWTNRSITVPAETSQQFNLTVAPSRVGEFVIETTITAGGENRTTLIDMRVYEPFNSVLDRYYQRATQRAQEIRQTVTSGQTPLYIGAIIGAALLILIIVYYRRQGPAPLEPQNR